MSIERFSILLSDRQKAITPFESMTPAKTFQRMQSPDGDPIHADYQAAAYQAIK